MPRMIQTRRARDSRGFTLVELLVVMAIIALVISILLPALGGARNAAKTATTMGLSGDIVKAAESFQLDNRRMAGRFTPSEMGNSQNKKFGLSGMENLLLDLAGGVLAEGPNPTGKKPSWLPICPQDYTSGKIDPVWVDPSLIGAQGTSAGKSYYIPQAKYYAVQPRGTGADDIGQFAEKGPADKSESDPQLPDVVDAWGNPLLAWTEDESGGTVSALNKFAAVSSDAGPAHFYWNQNAAFLQATALGRSKTDQTNRGTNSYKYSLIGGGLPDATLQSNLAVLLGNPNLPADISKDPVLPSQGRGRILVQSAGLDGYYMGKKDRGGKRTASGNDVLLYGMNFYKTGAPVKADRLKDRDGKETTFDLKDEFDDIAIAGGN